MISTIEFQQVTPPSSTHFRTPDSVIARLPLLDAEATEFYVRVIQRAERLLAMGTMAADEAHELAVKLAQIEDRCPDEPFRQRLASVLERLRAL